MQNSFYLDGLMSVYRVIWEWRVVVLLLMDGGVSVVCVSVCISFSGVRVCVCRKTLYSGTYGWYFSRLAYLGGYWWK